LHPVAAKETLIAVVVNGEEANLLRVPPGSPALAAERITFLPQGQPLEYAQSIMRGDRYKVVLDLTKLP
jgi:GntR family transcriptional regulator